MNQQTTRPATAVCSACKHWNNESKAEKGECRRYAPQTLAFVIDSETKFESRFPVTKATDWCGEFDTK